MGVVAVTLSGLAVALMMMLANVQAGGECPEVSQVYSCNPKCVQTYECGNGKVCCPNSCHLKSCVEPAKYASGGSGNKYQNSGAGTYCNNVKCSSFEVCKLDKATNRMKCQRA